MLTQDDQNVAVVEPIKVDPKDTSIPLADRIAAAKAAREAEQKVGKKKAAASKAVASHPTAKKAVAKISKAKPVVKAEPKKKAMAKTEPKKAAPKKVEVKGHGRQTNTAVCSVCGKDLSRHSSVENGMGDTCAAKIKLLPKGVTLEQHYEGLTKTDVPDGWIKLSEAIAKAQSKGISGYRFIQACGGDRMIRKPINKFFQVAFVSGTRYINADCMKHLEDLKKV